MPKEGTLPGLGGFDSMAFRSGAKGRLGLTDIVPCRFRDWIRKLRQDLRLLREELAYLNSNHRELIKSLQKRAVKLIDLTEGSSTLREFALKDQYAIHTQDVKIRLSITTPTSITKINPPTSLNIRVDPSECFGHFSLKRQTSSLRSLQSNSPVGRAR